MKDQELDDRYEHMLDVVRQAGAYALERFADLASLSIRAKGVQDMATEADLHTEQLICSSLQDAFPEDGFLGEETASDFQPRADQGVWIVDPIDGTQPFVSNLTSWCVSIAYLVEGRVRLGAVYDPNRDELFAARDGQGASLNGGPLAASDATSPAEGLVGIGFSTRVSPSACLEPMARLLLADGMFHRCGSGALSLAHVAAGRLLAYFEPHMNCWDSLAGALLVREAGGRTNAELEDGLARTLKEGSVVLATGSRLYEPLRKMLLDAYL